jgi:hypothetical protein
LLVSLSQQELNFFKGQDRIAGRTQLLEIRVSRSCKKTPAVYANQPAILALDSIKTISKPVKP